MLATVQQLALDPARSQIAFSVRSTATPPRARCRFRDASGSLVLRDGEPVAASGAITVASLDSGLAIRDRHVLSRDFLDVRRHPEIRFASTAIRRLEPGTYELCGRLTIHGVTRDIAFPASVDPEPGGARLRAQLALDRRDYGVQQSRFDVAMVGAEVAIELELHAS